MKKYINFINESLTRKQQSYIDMISNYIKNNADFDIYEYDEEFEVHKHDGSVLLSGKLFLMEDDKAVRFNFDKERLVSIDLWNDFQFNVQTITNKPNFTMEIPGSIVNILDDIVDFINGDFQVNEAKKEPSVKVSSEEDVQLKSIKVNKSVFDQDIDVFESIKLFTAQVAYKVSNGLVISGLGGLGKTTEVESTLEEVRSDYVKYAGDASVAGLYEALFINRHKLILFDDIDSILDDKIAVNLLKAVLDTKSKREVSRALKTHFDSEGMTDQEIWDKYTQSKKLPKKFVFDGRIIFITNRPGDSLDESFMTRNLFVDVDPDKDQIIDRIYKIMPKVLPNVPEEKKRSTIEFMLMLDEKYPMKFPLNLRTFVHCLNIRVANEFMISIGGESILAWQMLIKTFLVKK